MPRTGLCIRQHAEYRGALPCSLHVRSPIRRLQAGTIPTLRIKSPELSLDSWSPYNNNQTNMFGKIVTNHCQYIIDRYNLVLL